MEKTNVKRWLPWQTFCYLVAAPNTRNKCRNSWKASRRWRRIGQGSLPWGIRFWACLDEELSPGSGCRAGSKTGWGGRGRGEMARGGRLRPEKRGRPGNSKNATLPARESFFGIFLHFLCIFWAFFGIFFCISQTRSYFFAIFLHFPDSKSFFGIFLHFPKPGVIFCNCLHFLDRVCHLHRLPDPYEKTTRKWTMLESRKRQENDKKMIRKWQKKMT